jgi:adenylate cyclase
MATRDPHAPAPAQPKRLRFDRYVLDLDRGGLLCDDNEIALRPKTFAVLRYLTENSGRLVSKDELFAAVWPNLAVTDDALVQSIGELRRAFGDDGPRLIKTIPRRGYRFESEVSVDSPAPRPSADAAPGAAAPDIVQATPPAGGVRRPAGLFAKLAAASQQRLPAAFAFAVLLVATVLWVGIGSGWRSIGVTEHADKSATKLAETGAKPAIAVLPLVNQNNDSAREYFVDGLTQDIINALGRFPELTVMSWNAVFPYKGKPASPGEIARKLAVRYQVEGSVRQTGDRLRVIAQLVDTGGRVLWSGSFDETLANVFALQDAITRQIVGALAIHVEQVEQRRESAKPTENLQAYDYLLRAEPALQRPERASIAQARVLLKSAIALDPNYASAYAALADSDYIAVSMGWAESPTAYLSRAKDMADKALSLSGSDVRAHLVLGRIDIFYHRYDQAMAEMDRAIAINPNNALALAGRGNILMWRGQTDAAIDALELAQRIDPELNPIDRFALGLAYYLKGRYDDAIEQAQSSLRKSAGANFSRIVLAAAYAQLKRTDEAARVVATIRRLDPTFDPRSFGSKFLNPADLERLRDGLRKARLYAADASLAPPASER